MGQSLHCLSRWLHFLATGGPQCFGEVFPRGCHKRLVRSIFGAPGAVLQEQLENVEDGRALGSEPFAINCRQLLRFHQGVLLGSYLSPKLASRIIIPEERHKYPTSTICSCRIPFEKGRCQDLDNILIPHAIVPLMGSRGSERVVK